MQKVKKELVVNYPRLRIFTDDIEQLFELLSQNFEQVKITIDGYQTNQFTDIASIKKSIVTDFSISGRHKIDNSNYWDEKIYLDLEKDHAILTLGDEDNILLLGLKQKISAILKHRKRKSNFFVQYWWISLLLLLILETSILLINNFTPYLHKELAVILAYLIPILMLLIYVLIYLTSLRNYTIVELKASNTKIGFFTRNRDTLLVNLISAFVGLILGIIGTLIAQWITK